MKPVRVFAAAAWLTVFASCPAHGQNDLGIWREFVSALKLGSITPDQIRPYEGMSPDVLLEQLRSFKEGADSNSSWNEWDAAPEIFRVENHVHFIVALGFGDTTKVPFCFTFVTDKDKWYYRHLESIFIRLDRTPSPPTSEFPDLPEATKAWQREEIYWSQIVYFYAMLTKEKGKDYFLNLLKDGAGYALAAKTWVPFVPPQRAFILYACWEQSRLRENTVVLEKLTDQEAVVKLQSHFFYLYKMTGHLKQQIPFDEYRRIFETIWQDRAANAGWTLEITCDDAECLQCVLRFTRRTGQKD
jgi:hypothetical protein